MPSLRLIATEMTDVLYERFPDDPAARDFRNFVDNATMPVSPTG